MEFEEITETIIGCTYKVHNTLGFGFQESVYRNSLAIELIKVGLECEKEKFIKVYYEGECVGKFRADIMVNDLIVLELKSGKSLAKEHEVQLVNYLTATMKPLGLLLNFGPQRVDVKRKVRVLPENI